MLIALFSLISNSLVAQKKGYEVSGMIKAAKDNEGIPFSTIYIEELQLGSASNEQGRYRLVGIPAGTYRFIIDCLGYSKQELELKIMGDTTLNFILEEHSLQLNEVQVMATVKNKSGTSATIDKVAMDFIQPSSLGDLLQLLPGQLTDDGTLNKRSQISLRQSGVDANTALGVGLMLDGVPLSNNSNLQQIKADSRFDTRATVNRGTDMRLVSTDHIDAVEVISGIPSAKFGDVSSGVVITKSKAGVQPIEIRLKANMSSKLIYVGKGFKMPGNCGSVHLGAEYTDAYPDVRESLSAYKRYSLQMNYTYIASLLEKPLRLGVKLTHIGTLDATKKDPDLTPLMDTYRATYNKQLAACRAEWQPGFPWISSLQYVVSLDHTRDVTDRQLTVSPNGVVPLPIGTAQGDTEGIYLPSEYLSEYTLTGKPFNVFSQLNGKTILPLGDITNVLLWGGEYRYEKNRGEGFRYDVLRPPFPTSSTSSRPRDFRTIPAMQTAALYVENKFSGGFHSAKAEIVAGVRISSMPGLPKKFNRLHKKWFAEPRVNVWLQFPSFSAGGSTAILALKGGYGEAVKFPTLDMLFPEQNYEDFITLNYFSQNRENSLLWVNTQVRSRENRDLVPNRNKKAEFGVDVRVGKIKISSTLFREVSEQGFSSNADYYIYPVTRYKTNRKFDYKPTIHEFESYQDTLLSGYSVMKNGAKLVKKGIEYSVQIPKINSIATSIVINGAYYATTYDISQPVLRRPAVVLNGKPYPYVGCYGWQRGEVSSRFNTNVWFNTHIPAYKLMFTTKIQSIWFSQTQTLPFDGLPHYYWGIGKEKTEFKVSDRTDPVLRFLADEYQQRFFQPNRTPLRLSVDLKATKEISNHIRVSFYANRLFFYSPLYITNLNVPVRMRETPYFGTEITIKL